MKREAVTLLTLGCLGGLTITVGIAATQLSALGGRIDAALQQKRAKTMQKIECDVTDPQGVVHHITTEREKDENGDWEPVADWKTRHQEAVTAFQT